MNNQSQLIKLRKVQMSMLEEFDRICTKYGLHYFLDSGTALGAVRHGGFIPWDDDVDLGMMRDDYESFLKIAPCELSDQYELQTRENEPEYHKFNAKIRKKGTVFPEPGSKYYNNRGIFIDVYPFDFISDNHKKAQRELRMSRKLHFLINTHQTLHAKRTFTHSLVARFVHVLPLERLEKKYMQLCLRYKDKSTDHVTCYSYRMLKEQDILFLYKDIYPTKRICFEHREFQIMNNTDAYLKVMYGNYMQLPPEEKRACHLYGEISFGD